MKKMYLMLVASLMATVSISAQSHREAANQLVGTSQLAGKQQYAKLQTRAAQASQPDSLVIHTNGSPSSKQVYTYNEENLLIALDGYNWEMGEWKQSFNEEASYDEQGRLFKGKRDEYGADGKVLYAYTYTHSYTDNTHVLLQEQRWGEGADEVVYAKKISTYNEAGYIAKEEAFVAVDADGDGKLDKEDGDFVWMPYGEVYTYEYDAEGRLAKNSYKGIDDGEAYEGVGVYAWNGENYIIEWSESFKGALAKWEDKMDVTAGNPEKESYATRSWNAESESWTEWKVTQENYIYYPEQAAANESIDDSMEAVKIAVRAGAVEVQTSSALPVEVYNLSGIRCYQSVVNGSAVINHLPAGVYVVRAGKHVQKVMVK